MSTEGTQVNVCARCRDEKQVCGEGGGEVILERRIKKDLLRGRHPSRDDAMPATLNPPVGTVTLSARNVCRGVWMAGL